MSRLNCKIFGHKHKGIIVEFRDEDTAAVTKCSRCNEKIILEGVFASNHILALIELGNRWGMQPSNENCATNKI